MKPISCDRAVPSMRALLVALSLVALALSGCTDDTPVPDDGEPEPGVVTDPTDYSYLQNGTDGAGWHVHDYWGGQDRLQLLDQEDPGCTGCTVSYSGDHGTTIGSFLPEPDHVVPQGTAWLHATATWDIESGDYDGVGLWVQTANGTDFAFVGELEQGQPLTFNSTHGDNDPPHQTLSLWEFQVRAMPPDGDGSSASTFSSTLRVEVERGLEIPPWPPHPDFWDGATELILDEASYTVTYDTQAGLVWYCAGCVGGPYLDDGVVVPFDADVVVIDVEATSELPITFGLRAHGADTRTYTELEPTLDEPFHKTWRMETAEHFADSPYAKRSFWAFNLYKDQVRQDDTVTAGHWQGTYDVTVTALKE